MDSNAHHLKLGTLVANLHSLETLLRVFLAEHNKECEPVVNFDSLAVGHCVRVNSLTNYDTLGKLVDKYNEAVKSKCSEDALGSTVVHLRDMIAHGRVLGRSPSLPYTLYKFGHPADDRVLVVASETMDECWFKAKIDFVFREIRKVADAAKTMGFSNISWD